MIITKQKDFEAILGYLEGQGKIFLLGCGECATTCKTGGEEEVAEMSKALEARGKTITGYCIPKAPCVAAGLKLELAKSRKKIQASDAVLVLACGLGAQSVKENLRLEKPVHIACDTIFIGATDAKGEFLERCSACGDCLLELTGMICPVTRCPKGLLNGPCGGQDKGKCEVDKDRDCAWVLIYNELKKQDKLDILKKKRLPKDHSRIIKPRTLKLG